MARIRAVQFDRAVVYASTTGNSAIIAPDGHLITVSGTWQQAELEARIPLLTSATLAERAGAVATQTHQRIAGVIENMSYLVCAHCGEQTEIFGSGGGASVAQALSRITGTQVPLLGQVPLDVRLREAGDAGVPLVLRDPDSPAALALSKIADELGARGRSLAGRQLGLTPR